MNKNNCRGVTNNVPADPEKPEIQFNLSLFFGTYSEKFSSFLTLGAGGSPFDGYVNDAFGVSHRAHASIVGPPSLLPSASGRLLEKEVGVLGSMRAQP